MQDLPYSCSLGSRLLVLREQLIHEEPDVVMGTDGSLLFYIQGEVPDKLFWYRLIYIRVTEMYRHRLMELCNIDPILSLIKSSFEPHNKIINNIFPVSRFDCQCSEL